LATSATFEGLSSLWQAWKLQHSKTYTTGGEEASRFAIFVENYVKIEKYNAEHELTKLGINKFSDLTGEEFKVIYASGGLYNENNYHTEEDYVVYDPSMGLADEVDWRTKGAVTPIKDQGQCGSCWSFSTTGVIESFHFINSGTLVSLSEQQLVDCNYLTDHGCLGGLPANAITYAAKYGLETEAQYPYKAKQGICTVNKTQSIKYVGGKKAVTPNNLIQFKAALVTMPVSVGIEADQDIFQHYTSGIITKDCGDVLDHAVLVVGYTTVNNVEAFIVKNSWGTDWGLNGYVYISTDATANDGAGVCGILMDPVVPTN